MRDHDDPRISVAIMHHPARAAHLDAVVRACRPLPVHIVADPDPTGIRSPLRTAKLAWAAVPPGATHHLVLQDDVVLTERFAEHLRHAVASRPHHGIALYVNGSGPQNSYLARRAAAVGSPWAPLSLTEWTPSQGLVLPAGTATELAEYLRTIPDEMVDDDEMIVIFSRQQGVPIVAALPNLLEHAGLPTLVEHYERNRAVVFNRDWVPTRDHWMGVPDVEATLAKAAAHTGATDHAVELTESRCLLRFVRPGSGEPIEHLYGWYWHDWCSLAGVDPDRLIKDCAARLSRRSRPVDPRVAVEVWAAAYLLGADSTRFGAGADGPRLTVLAGAIRSWVAAGLSLPDRRAVDTTAEVDLTEAGLTAYAAGRAAGVVR
jgi:hypothetical protein